jgi:hypothetical protein
MITCSPRSTNKIILFLRRRQPRCWRVPVLVVRCDVKALLEHRMGASPSRRPTRSSSYQAVSRRHRRILFCPRTQPHCFSDSRSGFKKIDAPTLIPKYLHDRRFTIFFLIAFTFLFPGVNLGALFTTSAIFGVILDLRFRTPRQFLRRNLSTG